MENGNNVRVIKILVRLQSDAEELISGLIPVANKQMLAKSTNHKILSPKPQRITNATHLLITLSADNVVTKMHVTLNMLRLLSMIGTWITDL